MNFGGITMKCGMDVQVSYTNDLWVIQEVLSEDIQFSHGEYQVNMIFTYDYISQFILDARIYIGEGILNVEGMILELAEQFGLPEAVMIRSRCEGERKKRIVNLMCGRDAVERLAWYLDIDIVDEVKSSIQNRIEELSFGWEKAFSKIVFGKWRDLEELLDRTGGMIQDWNQAREKKQRKKAPVWKFWRELYNHVYLEKEMLWKGYGEDKG